MTSGSVRVVVRCGDWFCQQALASGLGAAAGIELADPNHPGTANEDVQTDVVILDLSAGDSVESRFQQIREVRRSFPAAHLLVVEVDEGTDPSQLTELGVSGYFHRGEILDISQVVAAVRAAAAGLFVVPLTSPFSGSRARRRRVLMETFGLSRAEAEVLDLIREGLSNKEIARSTHYAPQTIKNMVSSCFRKLGVHQRAAAAERAQEVVGVLVQGASRSPEGRKSRGSRG
jgi:DNA-binding NarL/FixJ family response regulator